MERSKFKIELYLNSDVSEEIKKQIRDLFMRFKDLGLFHLEAKPIAETETFMAIHSFYKIEFYRSCDFADFTMCLNKIISE